MSTYKRIAAVSTTIGILRHLAEQRGPVPGADVARATNLPVGTVMCHLVTLEESGFVQKIGEYWKLGMGLALFWARVKSSKEAERESIENDLMALNGGGRDGATE